MHAWRQCSCCIHRINQPLQCLLSTSNTAQAVASSNSNAFTAHLSALQLAYLMSRGLSNSDARDVFKTFQKTALAHFAGNLILNCVVYNSRGLRATVPCEKQLLYGSFAQQTGGMVMQPDSRDSVVLATGLVSCVQSLLGRLIGRRLQQQPQPEDAEDGQVPQAEQGLQGFKLIDLSGLKNRASEQEEAGTVAYGDAEVIFNIAMERMVAGESWSERWESYCTFDSKGQRALIAQ